MHSSADLLQPFLLGLFAILGALIGGLTSLAVADKTAKHAAALEQRRAKLVKGEELVAVLSELSSWRATSDREFVLGVIQMEAKLNRAYALAITYYGDKENVASTFYSEGRKAIQQLDEESAELGQASHQYLVFQASARNLTEWVLEEMRRVNGALR